MKLEALDHPKTVALAAELGICLPQAIGHLELFWAFTAKKTPAGDVGKWPDSVLAHAAQWTGDPCVFVAAMLAVGYLEPHPGHRLIVHDWAEHMPNWVRAKLKKTKVECVTSDLSGDLSGYYKGREGKLSEGLKDRNAEAPSAPPSAPSEPTPPDKAVVFKRTGKKWVWGEQVDLDLANYMAAAITEKFPDTKPPPIELWANDIRLMRTADERDPDHIRRLFDWAHADDGDENWEGWSVNIRSPGKLREKWSTLAAKRQTELRRTNERDSREQRSIEDEIRDTSILQRIGGASGHEGERTEAVVGSQFRLHVGGVGTQKPT